MKVYFDEVYPQPHTDIKCYSNPQSAGKGVNSVWHLNFMMENRCEIFVLGHAVAETFRLDGKGLKV